MRAFHKELSSGKWFEMTFFEQMANIGSEVMRALSWKNKNLKYSQRAIERALELLALTISDKKNIAIPSRLKELTRLREALIDYFFCENKYGSSEKSWERYFYSFNYAVRAKY